MANVKISDLPAASTPLSGTELVPIVQSGVTSQTTVDAFNYFKQDGTGAVATTVQTKLRETVSVFDFMTAAQIADVQANTASVDVTAAINNALSGSRTVFLPAGTYKITSQLVFGANCGGLYGEGMYTSVLSKSFNGNLILCDAVGAYLHDFGIVGNGTRYTGYGIVPRAYNILIQHCRITDTAGSCIAVPPAVGSNTLAATYLRVDNCFLQPTNGTTTYSISCSGSDDVTRPTQRVFTNITGGSSLVDFSGMNYAVLRDSLGTLIKFDANSQKVYLSGNRFTNSAANLTIYGVDHVIDGNFWGFGVGYSLTIDSTAVNVFFGPTNNIVIGSSTNSSVLQNLAIGLANPNTVYSKLLINSTLPWLGSTTNPTIGNGSFTAYYQQDGRVCNYVVGILMNSTTTVGSGTYSFQLPFKALVGANGAAMVKSTAGVYYPVMCQVLGGSNVASIYLGTGVFASTSLALGTNATIDLSISYLIAPT